jgi:hypothetical protein
MRPALRGLTGVVKDDGRNRVVRAVGSPVNRLPLRPSRLEQISGRDARSAGPAGGNFDEGIGECAGAGELGHDGSFVTPLGGGGDGQFGAGRT